jgi:hypothetical protein
MRIRMDMHDNDELEDDGILIGAGSLLDDEDAEVGVVPDIEEDEFDPLDPTKLPKGFGLEGGEEEPDF